MNKILAKIDGLPGQARQRRVSGHRALTGTGNVDSGSAAHRFTLRSIRGMHGRLLDPSGTGVAGVDKHRPIGVRELDLLKL